MNDEVYGTVPVLGSSIWTSEEQLEGIAALRAWSTRHTAIASSALCISNAPCVK